MVDDPNLPAPYKGNKIIRTIPIKTSNELQIMPVVAATISDFIMFCKCFAKNIFYYGLQLYVNNKLNNQIIESSLFQMTHQLWQQGSRVVSWADDAEESELFEKPTLTMEEFAKCIHSLMLRCQLDLPSNTAFHYTMDDTFIDIMVRNHLVISVSKIKHIAHETDDDTCSSLEELEATPDDQPEDQQQVDETKDSHACGHACGDDGWETVTNKRHNKKNKVAAHMGKFMEEDQKTYYFFKDEANCHYLDFYRPLTGIVNAANESKKYRFSHAYCIESNLVHDFVNPSHVRVFIPNSAYLERFRQWIASRKVKNDCDSQEFYTFKENSTWPTWTYLGKFKGISGVRQAMKDDKSMEFGHAYSIDESDLINLWKKDEKISHKITKAPTLYIERFQKYLQENKL